MNTVVLDGGKHGHEHFVFEDLPERIRIQTKENSGVYGRDRNRVSIYQDAGRYNGGCRIFSFVRSTPDVINGLVEVE